MDEVDRIRERIDQLDLGIVQLLKSRYENAKLLGRVKSRRGLDYRDPEREKTVLRKIERSATSLGLEPRFVRPIFEQIFSLSLEAQRDSEKSPKRLDGTRILIVGGTGGMGRFFARFASLQGAQVKMAGREINKTRKAAEEMEVEPGTILDAASSDIVILAVPMKETVRVASETGSLMRAGGLLADLASVKTGIADRVAERTPKNLEYVSLHPLFGPDTDQLNNQTIITVPYRTGPKWPRLARALQSGGAKLVTMTVAQHDRAMAYVQVLHHFALISLGLALNGMGGETKTRSLRETENRIAALLGNWETTVGIQQSNPFAAQMRQKFLEQTTLLAQARWERAGSLEKRLTSYVQKWSRKL